MTMNDAAHCNYIEPHREAAALRAENELLREELAKLITDLDYMTTTVLPAVEAEYNLKIGGLEYEAFMLECEVRRARRLLELAQSHVNRNENVPSADIESALEEEFSQWQAKVEEMRRGLEAAREFERAPRLSAAETRELQTLYRRLARRLHPDLNPRQTERERNLWLRVADAYRDGASDELRALSLLLDGEPAADEEGGAQTSLLEALRRRRDELRAHAERVLARLALVRSAPPYTLRQKLDDGRWLAARAAELREKVALLKEHRLMLDAAYRQLSGACAPPLRTGDEESTGNEEWPEIIWEA